jgi:prepilin-type processing-associated H-X9-DG protein
VVSTLGLTDFPDDITQGPTQLLELLIKTVQDVVPAVIAFDPALFRQLADQDRTVPQSAGNGGGTTIYRLRDGIERFLITDINNPAASARAQSEVFVMSDNVATRVERFNHVPGGANVLYMDGHVAFVRYPGPAPVTRSLAAFMHVFDAPATLGL